MILSLGLVFVNKLQTVSHYDLNWPHKDYKKDNAFE